METAQNHGIEVQRSVLNDVAIHSLQGLRSLTEYMVPDFNDNLGNSGFVVWRRNRGDELTPELTAALGALEYHLPVVQFALAQAVQVNIQEPRGRQEFHIDKPFPNTIIAHLDDGGALDYRTRNGKRRTLRVNARDVVTMTSGDHIAHRGRNLSDVQRITAVVFFGAGVMLKPARVSESQPEFV